MENKKEFDAYNRAFETIGYAHQITMLYYKAISYVMQAREAIRIKDYDSRHRLINKTIAIVDGLRASLDFDNNEQIAKAMQEYYEAMDKMLLTIQCNNDTNLCDDTIKNLRLIKNAWEEIARQESGNFEDSDIVVVMPAQENNNNTEYKQIDIRI